MHRWDALVIEEARKYLEARVARSPRVAVVLGSGLGAFAAELEDAIEVPYEEIPGWPRSTAVGHAGKLVFGSIGATETVVMAGRAHLYEGYTPAQVVFPIRVLARLGVRAAVFTNAAGGINLAYGQGALVLISDHINLQGSNPLAGPNDDTLGPRFPDMSDAYSARLRTTARAVAESLGTRLQEGVYAACSARVTRRRPRYATCAPSARIWWNVDRTRSDCGASHGRGGPGDFLRHQHGLGHLEAEDLP
jgi:purine-nucleoside phosphorylase